MWYNYRCDRTGCFVNSKSTFTHSHVHGYFPRMLIMGLPASGTDERRHKKLTFAEHARTRKLVSAVYRSVLRHEKRLSTARKFPMQMSKLSAECIFLPISPGAPSGWQNNVLQVLNILLWVAASRTKLSAPHSSFAASHKKQQQLSLSDVLHPNQAGRF